MRSRIPAAILFTTLVGAIATGQTPAQPDPKDPPKERTKLPEPKWPTEIGGKNAKAWLKDVTDPDPAIRESALRTLPNFGPDVRKDAGRLLLIRMAFPVDGGERDPGVRITLFNAVATIGFENPKDEVEAIRILGRTADEGLAGGLARLHAVQTLGLIGGRAEPAVQFVTGVVMNDPSYETRRNVARTLGQIGFSETRGPNDKALRALAGTLAKDVSVAVRMEALQSLVLLGPPWAAPRKADDKNPPKINEEAAKFVADAMRTRITGGKGKAAEPDKQLEIWCRVVLMRFDPKEINDENLGAIARHTSSPEAGPKIQALQALALFGEQSAPQINAVVRVLGDTDTQVLGLAVAALGGMGVKAHGAIPELEKLEKKLAQMRDDQLKKPEVIKVYAGLKPEEQARVRESLQEEQMRKVVVETIKWIRDSKPGMPGGDRPTGGTTPEPKKG